MAADEDPNNSCIFDPNFAIICSFFEKFSPLCGIKKHTFKELQEMIDSVGEIPPQLVDLHIRLMRKARKNVNPERWQRTLAKFCYFTLPEDCWELEQKGYEQLNHSQRLRILLALLGAQFDYNVKFKNNVNKLGIGDLRLAPFGKDKNGNSYWLHEDEDLNLKIYKEDLEEEKWELVAKNRDELEKLIENLMHERDPNRKLDEIENDDEEEPETETKSEEESVSKKESADEVTIADEKVAAVVNPEQPEPNQLQTEASPQPGNPNPQFAEPSLPPPELNQQLAELGQIQTQPSQLPSERSKEPPELIQLPVDVSQRPVEPSQQSAEVSRPLAETSEQLTELSHHTIEPSQQQVELTQPIQNSVDSSIQSDKKESKETPSKSGESQPNNYSKDLSLKRSPSEQLRRSKSTDLMAPKKPIDLETFTQHLKTLDSHNLLRPLLSDNLSVAAATAAAVVPRDSLKTKINQKFNAIRPVASKTKDLLVSKMPNKPGLKLEQILKSKLAQKLAANSPSQSEAKSTKATSDITATASSSSTAANAVGTMPSGENEAPVAQPIPLVAAVTTYENPAPLKHKLSNYEVECEPKKAKISEANDEDGEIEEPVMLVTGVGSGNACETGNETETEKRCDSTAPSNATATNQLTHKVDDILKKGESENCELASTSEEMVHHLPSIVKTDADVGAGEKKKPKLWTIDAICSTDSKETKSHADDISSFPNYSFNRESKKSNENSLFRSCGSSDSYSIFNLAADPKEDLSISNIPTNFYFGCNNQNPCFVSTDRSPMNNFKPQNKSHNVKDIVDNLETNETDDVNVPKVSKFNVISLCSDAASENATQNDLQVEKNINLRSSSSQASGDAVNKLLNSTDTSNVLSKATDSHLVADGSHMSKSAVPGEMSSTNKSPSPNGIKHPNECMYPGKVSEVFETKAADEDSLQVSQSTVKPCTVTESEAAELVNSISKPLSAVEKSTVITPEIDSTISPEVEISPVNAIQIVESLPAEEGRGEDEINQNVESKLADELSLGDNSFSKSKSEDGPLVDEERLVVDEPTPVDIQNYIINESVALGPQTEAVKEETSEKTVIKDVNNEFSAVKSPHLVPSEGTEPRISEVQNKSVHHNDCGTNLAVVSEETVTSVSNSVSNVASTLTSELPVSASVTAPVQNSDVDSTSNKPSELSASKETVADESHPDSESTKEIQIQSSSVETTTEMKEETSVKLNEKYLIVASVPESEQQSAEVKAETSLKTFVKSEPQVADKNMPTAQESISILVDSIEPKLDLSDVISSGVSDIKIESKDLDPSLENVEEPKKRRRSRKIDTLTPIEGPSRATRSTRSKPADEVVIPTVRSNKLTKMPSKGEEETADQRNGTSTPIRGGNRRGRQPKVKLDVVAKGEETSSAKNESTENDTTSEIKPAARRGRGRKSGVNVSKVTAKDSLETSDKIAGKEVEISDEQNSTEETAEKKESQPEENISQDSLNENGKDDDEIVDSGKRKTNKSDVDETKPATRKSQASANENIDSVNDESVQQPPAEMGPSRRRSRRTDLDEPKPVTRRSQLAADESSNDNTILEAASVKIKTTKFATKRDCSQVTEAENGSQREESTELSVATRKGGTRRSQPITDEEDDSGKGKPLKRGRGKASIVPAVENKRRGRRSKLVLEEVPAKKAKGKVVDDSKRGSGAGQKTQSSTETGDEEKPATTKPAATTKKKGGRGKKLSQENFDDVENDDDKKAEPETKSNDEGAAVQNETTVNGNERNEENDKKNEKTAAKKRVTKRGWINEVDVKNIEVPNSDGSPGIRQSRRIAQLKIKEQAEVKYVELTTPKKAAASQKSKAVSSAKKNCKSPNKKSKNKSNRDESEDDVCEKFSLPSKKKKKKKESKKNFDVTKAWKGSSDTSSEEDDADEDDHFEEDEEELIINDASDHEFSPESDIDDEDYAPVKRARTAHLKPSAEDKIERDDLSCQSCGTADQPEWILLCDTCDEGWHASCLKPPILSIPEGDWFCPPCQHNKLITNLQKFLMMHDKNLKKKANEELRKKRLEYVDISFSNIIIDSQASYKVSKPSRAESDRTVSTDDSSSDDESEEEEEEPLYQLRVRRQVNVSDRLNEYEELMNSAIQREDNIQIMETVPELDVGADTQPLQNGKEELRNEEIAGAGGNEEAEKNNEEGSDENPLEEKKVAPVILNLRNIRKKPPRLTKLDVSSEDDRYSDEDFKGSSAEDQDDDDEYGKSESNSDEAEYRSGRHGPVRRSTRARVARYDNDFINDDSDDDEDEEYGAKKKKKKKKRKRYSESDSEEDSTWGKRKKSKYVKPSRSFKPPKKKRRRIRFEGDSDEDRKKVVRSRVKYGLDESEEEYPQRRTRGKKINYVEDLESDSEEEEFNAKKKPKRILSDDDEYIEDDDDDGNEHNANLETSKSNSEEEDINSKSDTNTTPEKLQNDESKKSSTTDSTKAVSPTQPSTESTSPLEEKTNSSEVNETNSSKTNDNAIDLQENIPLAEEVATKPSMPVESAKTVNQAATTSKQQSYSSVIQEDPKIASTIVDGNTSLKGMQSMAQNLSQASPAPTTAYSATPVSTSSGPASVNFADVGIRYEDSESEKYSPPIRVVSPSKLYGMQDQKRPPLPPQFAATSHMQSSMSGPPPSRMIIPHTMVNAMQMPVSRPMLAGPPMRHPLPRALLPPQPNMGLPPNTSSPPTKSPAKQGRKSRSKKQQEQERLEREAMEMAGRGGEEMMPLHMLKGSPVPQLSDMHLPRPPPSQPQMPPFSTASGPPFMPYPNVQQQMRFPQQQQPPPSLPPTPTVGTPVTGPVGNTSKRVKITPTRMRMISPQNMMRYPRAPGTAMYRPPLSQASDVPSSCANSVSPSDKGPMPTPPPSNIVPVTSTAKSEPVSTAPPTMKAEPYYLPMSSYSPSQISRGPNMRPEFTFVRNPMPPSMYRQPVPVSGAPPPLTVTSSYSQMPHPYTSPLATISGGAPPPHPPTASLPPGSTLSPAKPDAAAKTPPSSVPAAVVPVPPVPYSSPYTPPLSTSSPVSSPKMTPATYTLPPSTLAGPPPTTSPYQMLRVKQLPRTVAATMQSSTVPNMMYPPPSPYYSSPMMHTSSYGQHPPPSQLPATSQPQPPPMTSYSTTPSTPVPPPSTVVAGSGQLTPPQPVVSMPSVYKPPPTTSTPAEASPTSLPSGDYTAPTSQAGEFTYPAEVTSASQASLSSSAPPTSCAAPVESQNPAAFAQQPSTYDKDEEQQQPQQPPQAEQQQQQPQTPTEESSGEFGGLVSYFSSQHEDDLDA